MAHAQSQGFVGRPMARREDARLLVGEGQFVADMVLPGMGHVAFVRSPHAHARIRGVDLARARALPGVWLALSGAELQQALPAVGDQQLVLPRKWRTKVKHEIIDPRQPLLAFDKVRHVGEAVAVIVAENRYIAEDAAELVELDLEVLPPAVDPTAALEPGAPVLHERYGTNLLAEFSIAKGDVALALSNSPHRLKRSFYHHRYAAVPMECRGVIAQYDKRTRAYTIWSSTQMVHWVRREVATTLAVSEASVRCIAPDVGGGFGGKGHVYPEDVLLPFLAQQLGVPVKWIEDRREHMQSACHSRDQLHEVEIGFDANGCLLALRDEFVMDCGAWNPVGIGIPYNTASHMAGPYKVPNLSVRGRVVATNKVPNAPYRGAGRPEAAQAIERMMDLIARELALEPAEVRRRNMVGPADMPYAVGIPYRDGEPVVYDSGDYPAALAKAIEASGGVEAFRVRQLAARKRGVYLGLGLGVYTEGTGVGPFEGATMRIEPSGKLYVASGACPQGQGMETIYSQIAADLWKVDPANVVIALADTGAIPMGFGTIASRSTVHVSAAMHVASEKLLKKVFVIAGNMLECAPGDLELRPGGVGIAGIPGRELSLGQIAHAARPGWDHQRPPGVEAGLEETCYWEAPTVTWSYAAHAVQVEVDIELGKVTLQHYAIAHDCGVVVNPMLAEGQIIGGTVQGIGGALLEGMQYDAEGQLLTGSLMDYLLPTASDVPHITLIHQETRSPLNPLGVKGLGEGGAIAPPVAIANAVCDALAPFGVEFNTTPIGPEQIVRAVREARARQAVAA